MVSWGGTSRNGSLGQKKFIGMAQVEIVHWGGTSGTGSLGWYK